MKYSIGIQPDEYAMKNGTESSSRRWLELLSQLGHEVRTVDVFRSDILHQLDGCDGFMWRHGHYADHRAIARRLLPALEYKGLCIYPDQHTCWHYDDKIAQYYLLNGLGIPMPRTWVFWKKEEAETYIGTAEYPLVLKLWSGAGSNNVTLLRSLSEARRWVDRLFGPGVYRLSDPEGFNLRLSIGRVRRAVQWVLVGRRWDPGTWWDLHKNYIMLQEFVPRNDFDTRITVIGRRAFGFRRFNRDADFRASGSGKIDWDVTAVDPRFIRLAFKAAGAIRAQSCAIDGLLRDEQPVTCEITYTFASGAVRECPGHWELEGDPEQGKLIWIDGHMWPEEAQVQDFLARLDELHGMDRV
ncbi:MAG: hypothetical protein JXQ75_23165 [Phycisphaerae bacterium]|nr:hypothetical protein [Phycisphaerae bacterium]